MYQANKIYLEALKITVILHLIEIDFLTKYLEENAENSISELLNFKHFWGDIPPQTLQEARASGTRCIHPITKPSDIKIRTPLLKTQLRALLTRDSNTVFDCELIHTRSHVDGRLGERDSKYNVWLKTDSDKISWMIALKRDSKYTV